MEKGKVFKFQTGKWWYQQTVTSYVYIIPRETTTMHTHTHRDTLKNTIDKDGILNFSNNS